MVAEEQQWKSKAVNFTMGISTNSFILKLNKEQK
jgi:hypothetical protein